MFDVPVVLMFAGLGVALSARVFSNDTALRPRSGVPWSVAETGRAEDGAVGLQVPLAGPGRGRRGQVGPEAEDQGLAGGGGDVGADTDRVRGVHVGQRDGAVAALARVVVGARRGEERVGAVAEEVAAVDDVLLGVLDAGVAGGRAVGRADLGRLDERLVAAGHAELAVGLVLVGVGDDGVGGGVRLPLVRLAVGVGRRQRRLHGDRAEAGAELVGVGDRRGDLGGGLARDGARRLVLADRAAHPDRVADGDRGAVRVLAGEAGAVVEDEDRLRGGRGRDVRVRGLDHEARQPGVGRAERGRVAGARVALVPHGGDDALGARPSARRRCRWPARRSSAERCPGSRRSTSRVGDGDLERDVDRGRVVLVGDRDRHRRWPAASPSACR